MIPEMLVDQQRQEVGTRTFRGIMLAGDVTRIEQEPTLASLREFSADTGPLSIELTVSVRLLRMVTEPKWLAIGQDCPRCDLVARRRSIPAHFPTSVCESERTLKMPELRLTWEPGWINGESDIKPRIVEMVDRLYELERVIEEVIASKEDRRVRRVIAALLEIGKKFQRSGLDHQLTRELTLRKRLYLRIG